MPASRMRSQDALPGSKLLGFEQRVHQVKQQKHGNDSADYVFRIHTRSQKRTYQNATPKKPRTNTKKITSSISFAPYYQLPLFINRKYQRIHAH